MIEIQVDALQIGTSYVVVPTEKQGRSWPTFAGEIIAYDYPIAIARQGKREHAYDVRAYEWFYSENIILLEAMADAGGPCC